MTCGKKHSGTKKSKGYQRGGMVRRSAVAKTPKPAPGRARGMARKAAAMAQKPTAAPGRARGMARKAAMAKGRMAR